MFLRRSSQNEVLPRSALLFLFFAFSCSFHWQSAMEPECFCPEETSKNIYLLTRSSEVENLNINSLLFPPLTLLLSRQSGRIVDRHGSGDYHARFERFRQTDSRFWCVVNVHAFERKSPRLQSKRHTCDWWAETAGMNSFSPGERPPEEKWFDCLANLLYVCFPDLVDRPLKIQPQPEGT